MCVSVRMVGLVRQRLSGGTHRETHIIHTYIHTYVCVLCVYSTRLGGRVLCEGHGVGGGVLVAGVAPA